MTTRKFSATDLPYPRYSLELGRLSIRSREQRERSQQKQAEDNGAITNNTGAGDDLADDGDVNLPSTCLPRFSQLAQVVEVKKPGLTLPGRVSSNIKDFLGSYCMIENARPELFVRRDFISKFVDKGTIHISQLSDHQATTKGSATSTSVARQSSCSGAILSSYKLATRNNVMKITMTAKQYHRFGLVARKVISLSAAGPRKKSKRSLKGDDDLYLVEIDLRDDRIKKSNKHQDRLVSALRRLSAINKVYFRFIPDKSELDLNTATANELSFKFFNHVIEEYALDGCQPVPLTSCTICQQKVERNWVNYSQLHPELGVGKMAEQLGSLLGKRAADAAAPDQIGSENANTALAQLINIIDWLGFQLLRLDCDHLSKILGWNDATVGKTKLDRVDVSCTRVIGSIDSEQVRNGLTNLFNPNGSKDVLLRALILYTNTKQQELEELQSCSDDIDGECISGAPKQTCGETRGSNKNAGVVYIQDLSDNLEVAQEITVIGMT